MTNVDTAMPSATEAQRIPLRTSAINIPAVSNSTPTPITSKPRNAQLNLDTFSPVNQNGSFEFDRVLKSGYVNKRTRKTKTWKPIYLVLRPNLLSIYKDSNETKLRHKVLLSDLTAVAFLKDPKQKRKNVFGLFSPSRNYHLEAKSKEDAAEWVDLIRREARIEEEEEEMFLASPGGNVTGQHAGFDQAMQQRVQNEDRLASSSPEPTEQIGGIPHATGIPPQPQRRPSHIEYSGNELASHSDMSDAEVAPRPIGASQTSIPEDAAATVPQPPRPIFAGRNVSQMSGLNVEADPERVLWQGRLLYLKSKNAVKQWKDIWAVVRPKNFALYKDENEYAPLLIIPFSSIINVVEIDPVSRTKRNCLQVITEEKSYRFCAHSEEGLDKSLGAFKSLLAKRKELEGKKAVVLTK